MLDILRRAVRRLFLAADGPANAVFGERYNPLYHIGAISYALFWLVVISGFYVYAFYDTGVDTTFRSVERLTHEQWFAGGLMRSLHRYASDAMVITMALHLLRHFAFDRYRGFRAFSWITGVIVLVLVIVSGVNGFMLPWDRTAQLVVVATGEWFDALPVLQGALIRNFVVPGAISDRFFSLLSFLHIGLPLAVLGALWVHTQRVAQAKTMPPRRLSLALLAAFVVLSFVRPVLSQGAADLSSLPARLDLDWFYLAPIALLDSIGARALWAATGVGLVLMLLLPVLSGRLRGDAAAHSLKVEPDGRTVAVRPGETLLEAGLRGGVPLPFDCRSGGCGECKATLLEGDVDHGIYRREALGDDERSRGEVLLCCATARSDVVIACAPAATRRAGPVPVYDSRVERIERLGPDVALLALRLEHGRQIAFAAGQYVNVLLDDGSRRSYSFSTRSGETDCLELHVRRVPGGRFTTEVFERLQPGDRIEFEGPFGRFVLRDSGEGPLIFVAGATGFAPVKGLLEEAFFRGLERPLYLYWGVRRPSDLYMAALPEKWAREHANFRFVPVLSEPQPSDHWTGRTGLVHEAILADFPDLTGCEIYACGSLQMVDTARGAFLLQGLAEDRCYSDAFTPRSRRDGETLPA